MTVPYLSPDFLTRGHWLDDCPLPFCPGDTTTVTVPYLKASGTRPQWPSPNFGPRGHDRNDRPLTLRALGHFAGDRPLPSCQGDTTAVTVPCLSPIQKPRGHDRNGRPLTLSDGGTSQMTVP